MSDATLIEVDGEAVAIVVPEADRYRFVAVKLKVWSLDDRLFQTPEDARRAAVRTAGRRRRGGLPSASTDGAAARR